MCKQSGHYQLFISWIMDKLANLSDGDNNKDKDEKQLKSASRYSIITDGCENDDKKDIQLKKEERKEPK
jgi:hypothetical protein